MPQLQAIIRPQWAQLRGHFYFSLGSELAARHSSDFASLSDYIPAHDACDDNHDHYHLGFPGADGRGLNRTAAARFRAALRRPPELFHPRRQAFRRAGNSAMAPQTR